MAHSAMPSPSPSPSPVSPALHGRPHLLTPPDTGRGRRRSRDEDAEAALFRSASTPAGAACVDALRLATRSPGLLTLPTGDLRVSPPHRTHSPAPRNFQRRDVSPSAMSRMLHSTARRALSTPRCTAPDLTVEVDDTLDITDVVYADMSNVKGKMPEHLVTGPGARQKIAKLLADDLSHCASKSRLAAGFAALQMTRMAYQQIAGGGDGLPEGSSYEGRLDDDMVVKKLREMVSN
ncbi:hypothetical protein DFJ74DRAFT_687769 [Hyaloraphidium curvatum]|nr:hypothetical protein DFJ74DRAFT_687769 [Hyaloraphidium curvatum]